MGEQKRALMVAAEALAVNGRLLDEHFDTLDPVVVSRMAAGRALTASDYFAVMRRWATLRARITRTLADVDALLVPTTMAPARPVSVVDATPESYAEHNAKYLRNTSLGNILNLCAVCLPCGFTAEGLPIGLMIYAKPFDEAMALRVAWAYEQATEWHARRPDLSWVG
jgi:aspartyl-tRNA(Asn)/glutamyl-tRNA(Gln) amidotransferase subunit A